jgi:hypothetical protein
LGAGNEPAAEASVAETPLDPTAAALAAEVAKGNPELAQEASAYFRRQSHLVGIQTEHLHEQRAVNLQLLRLRRFGERLRVGLQLFVILVATVIGIGGAILIRDAFNSRSVVVEPFDAPPALVARGVTGKVVADGLLDELRRLQSATRADAAKRDLANAWTGEIKLAVPEAGISLGEISRMLKARFGNDLHIEGEVIQTEPGGLALTVRGDAVAARKFTGTAGDLDNLITQAAGYVYSQSEPVLWAYYLTNKGHNDEALAFSKAAYAGADKADRPYLLNTWAKCAQRCGWATARIISTLPRSVEVEAQLLGRIQQRNAGLLAAWRRGERLEGRGSYACGSRWPPWARSRDLLSELGYPYLEPRGLAQ